MMFMALSGAGNSQPLSQFELDESMCYQMRKQGYSEEEIKKFMEDSGGYYHEPENED